MTTSAFNRIEKPEVKKAPVYKYVVDSTWLEYQCAQLQQNENKAYTSRQVLSQSIGSLADLEEAFRQLKDVESYKVEFANYIVDDLLDLTEDPKVQKARLMGCKPLLMFYSGPGAYLQVYLQYQNANIVEIMVGNPDTF